MRGVILTICALSLLILKNIRPEVLSLQFSWVILGLLIFFLVSRLQVRFYKTLWPLFYFFSFLFLALTFFGPEVRGAKRWLEFFSLKIQPSEIVKPFIILSWAGFLSGSQEKKFLTLIKYLALFLPPFVLIFKQPDLGNSLVYLGIFLFLILVSGFSLSYFFLPVIFFALTSPFIWQRLAEYQRLRIISFLTPNFDLQGAGYNALQALIAVGSGGLFGRGLGEGTQSRLKFLPEFHTDFIFASLVEQLGFLGGAFLLALYFFLLWQILKIGKEGDQFENLVSLGVFSQIFIQVVMNVGMNLGLLPITGITLPLFSFGGSSLIGTLIALGIVFSFPRRRKETVAIR